MRLSRTLTVMTFALAIAVPRPARAAANKEHLQLLAEIRMLQEQQQQLQAMIGALSDSVKAVSTKLDDQSAAMRKVMADQGLTLSGLGENVRIVREKVDDSNVRIANVSQEIDALRQAIVASQAAAAAAQTPPGGAPGTEPSGVPPVAPAGQPPAPAVNPLPLGVSPQRAFDASFDDYSAGRYDLAIKGFESYISSFPKSPSSAQAQFYIGQSYFSQSKWPEARDAFQKVISDYPQTPPVPDAYYKLGQTYEHLGQIDLAKRTYETAVKAYPGRESILSQQALDRLNRK